jgi:acyl-CoA thioester hydrolase
MSNSATARVIYKHQITVLAEDIDEMGHVNNVVYLRWIQDVAEAHWKNIAPDELRAKYAWVVLRQEIDYVSPAVLDDVMIGTTWVDLPNGVRSIRHVEIFNQTTNKFSARAKTEWCLLSLANMRPKRIEKDITDVFC